MSDEFMESTSGGPKLPALKFAKVGDTHTGTVTEVTKLQDKDPAGNVKTYDNGDPRWVFVFTLDTPTGASNLWVRGQMVKAIREAAEKAGVKKGDVLLEFGGISVAAEQQLIDLLKTHKAGDEVDMLIFRDGKSTVLKAKLTAQK